jgi:hypothetical protein
MSEYLAAHKNGSIDRNEEWRVLMIGKHAKQPRMDRRS